MTDHPRARLERRRGGRPRKVGPLAKIAVLCCIMTLLPGLAQAAIDWSQCRTEGGYTEINGTTSQTVTLGTAITDTSKAFLLVDFSGPDTVDQGQEHMVSGYISSASQLIFERGSATSRAEVSYNLVECFNNELSVQRGEIALTGATTGTDTISAVDTTRSIVIVSSRTNDGTASQDTGLVTGELTDSTTVQVQRANGTGNAWVRYEVVTFSAESAVTVQTGEVTLPSGSANVTDTLSPTVDLSRSWLYHSWDASNDGLQQGAVAGQITATNEVTFYRHAASAYVNRIRWYAVEFPAATVSVQRGSEPLDSSNCGGNDTECNVDITITAVGSITKAFPFVTNTTQGTGTAFPRNRWIETLFDTATLRTTSWRTDGTNSNNYKHWQVVEFPQSCTPTGTLSITPGQVLSGNPIDLTSINESTGATNFGYTAYEGACPAGGSLDQLDDFAGLADGTRPNFGNWTGVNGSDGTLGWVALSGATGSGTTGPSNGNPDPYVYLESSASSQTYGVDVTAGSSQYIESNVIDASAYSNLEFTFDWNMNVNDNTNASLHLDAWNGNSWDPDVTGGAINTGNNGDTWVTTGPVDLSGYSNSDFQLRIRYIVGTGTIYQNDVAVDNLHFTATSSPLFTGNQTQAQSVDTTGWLAGSKCLQLTGDDASCGTPLTPDEETFTWNAFNAATIAGTVTAVPSGCDGVAVTAPYSSDDDGDNTLSYRYRTPSGSGVWTSPTNLPHSASPYSFTISGLTHGATYDVEVTYVDPDGVTGTNPQTLTNITVGGDCTGAGTVTVVQTTGATPSLAVSAPYTFDNNGDNTLSYRYQVSGSGSWVGPTGLPHSASPYGFTLDNLTCGESYDVEVTYVDPDGIGSGTAVQTVSDTVDNCTAAGTASATVEGCDQITVSAPFSYDANGDGTVSFERSLTGQATWSTVTGCGSVGGPSPRTCVDTTVTESTIYDYRVTYSDPDAVTGTAQQVIGPYDSGICNQPEVDPGVPTAAADSCSQITVTMPYTGDTNNDSTTAVEYNTFDTWPGTQAPGCGSLSGGSPRTCAVSGLTNATTYFFRVTFSDPDTVVPPNPQVTSAATQDCRVVPGTPTANVDACTQITVSAPYSGDANADSTTTFRRGGSATGPWTAVCSNVSGASPRGCVDNGVAESTSYWYQVEFSDADGVNGTNPQVIGSFTTPACAANDTTTGAPSAFASGCNQITVTVPFVGDANNDGSVLVEYNTSNNWPGTTACGAVGGPSPRTCLVTGLNASTSYWTRVTFSDPDGVTGTNPRVTGPDATPACSGNGTGPMIQFLAPSRNATVGGTDRVKLQVYDPDGLDPTTPVEYSIDGGTFTAIGVTENTNYDCNRGSETSCAVYEFDLDTTGLANGNHSVTVRATDNAAAATSSQLSRGIEVNNDASSAAAGGGFLLRRTRGSQICSDCHNLATHNSQAISFKYGNWAQECSTCHTPHLTKNIFLILETIETPNSGQKSVDFRNQTGVAEFSYATPQASGNGVNICEACHTKTKNSDSTPRSRNDAPTDWSKHYTSQCTGCHAHTLGFGAGESEGGADCAGCHPDIWDGMNGNAARISKHAIGNVAGTNDAPTDSGLSWGSPLSSNAAAARSCLNMCHNDHPHTTTQDTTHEYNVYRDATSSGSRDATGTSTRTNRARTDFDNAATNGGMCVSCHRNPISASWPTIPKADYNASAHNYTTDAGGAWQYTQHDGGVFDRNCSKCHSDGDADGNATTIPFGAVHYSDNPRLLSNALNPNGTAASNVCYNCHGNGTTGTDRSGKNLVAFTSKTYNHPVDDDAVHDGAAEYSVAYNDGTFKGANRHVNCDDCHNPHKAGTTLHSAGTNVVGSTSPLYGATGVSFTSPGTNWSNTASGNFSWTTSVTREHEVCFKCHSSFAFNGSPPTGQTDVAQEFSTSNASYHPVVGALPANDPGTNGSSRLTSGQLTNGWSPGDTMYCSDCHGPETAGPAVQGPHGSAIQYILWPSRNASYTVWPGIGRMQDSWDTTFCRNCHPMDEDSNWSNNKAHDKHASRSSINGCYSCHILVPHGGKMSRLVGDRDGTMPARYAYQGNLNNMEISSFTKQTDPSQYNKQDCRAACEDPGDHEQDANENW